MLSSNIDEPNELSDAAKEAELGYNDSAVTIDAANSISGGRFLAGKRKLNNLVKRANALSDRLEIIGEPNMYRSQSDYAMDIAQQNLNRYAGQNYMTAIGRNGLKLISAEDAAMLLALRRATERVVAAYKEGGVIGIDSSVLPEGALHAHKNHLAEDNPELEDVTPKGIPVVTVDEKGEVEQVAEIEREEVIFSLDITKQLEALRDDGSEEAMLEAGKLLAKELITNTVDNNE